MLQIKINAENENQRIDKYLLKYLNKAPKSFLYKMFRKKNIKLNEHKIIGNEIIKNGDIIEIFMTHDSIKSFKEEKQILKLNFDFKIIFEDDNIIICYKPIGLNSQRDIKNKSNSLNDQLLYYMKSRGYTFKDFTPSIVNRIDTNTSGIVIFAKNFKSAVALSDMLKDKLIEKRYLSVVCGKLKSSDTITLYHSKKKDKVIVSKDEIPSSKKIITKYKTLATKNNMSLLDIDLVTGKTHQIRATFEYMKTPILGDNKYNDNYKNKPNIFNLKNQFLHSYKITFLEEYGYLSYLNGRTFVCNYMSKSFQNILDFFNYKLN